ncbi:AAA family ATPase [Aeromonas caviae]|uniref:AAA family ATPase n=2 Tax=Aeromonas caviae TaxID=648 RepID=UPI000DD051B0|nr:AAA family ATPase [Aeromonas caviae]
MARQPNTVKTITGQTINSINIKKLKCLNDLNELTFTPHALTAILGPNGSGKSSILHALAGVYMPEKDFPGEDNKLGDFFPRSPDSEWNGSSFLISMSYRRGRELINDEKKSYGKSEARGSRWVPIYARRPLREVYYLGIDKCVPMIESEKKNSVQYVTSNVTNALVETILNKASQILNKRYTSLNSHLQPNGKKMIGVEANGMRYSSLSMSAGEQKIFLILETVLKADKYALILIYEIDLLLHDSALKRLIEVLYERATDKNIQIIFTTHREVITTMSHMVNIRHILNLPDRTYCFEDTKPDSILRLTGERKTSVEIYVEDDVAASVVSKICSSLKASKYVNIIKYGASSNAFTILGGALLRNEDVSRNIYILDGDVYRTVEQKENAINKVISGDDRRAVDLRGNALSKISEFILPEGFNPERHIHSMLTEINDNELDNDYQEIIDTARTIVFEQDAHNYLSKIIDFLGIERSVGLARIVDLASKHPSWEIFTSQVVGWLTPIIEDLREIDA